MKDVLNGQFLLKYYDPDQYQRGSVKKRLSLETYGHDRPMISSFLASSNFDILLYAHATAISCLQYYHNSMKVSVHMQEERELAF